ncbi:NAD(P)-dependent oxidoreductase [Murimonas intestini]|uniref:3-hydroxyisobutyrate dehydrogenase n=1 Tax=Murimonas intestini TaxID=1337051 RepID=A0AB73T3N8_9FIRM|nr:NAD(P)-dependent oxidoreductase [Murimonas intestini]MCR1841598.1 NAD(P)-dependent oxidoreductase [Murimonas intestini]MCR1868484.1 NAD(P)-dependent oxidoreductase [Murimonas intestini]MCR1886085.1 NAD(P)-dependent oxidoreductase [Murimonas intestini]
MKIGFVGLGTMGGAMCANIVKKHQDKVYVYDVQEERVRELEAAGAIACESSLAVAESSDIIITMVPRSEHSLAVWEEMLPALTRDKTGIDMSTIDPDVSLKIARLVQERTGAGFADCPVVKSKAAAISGKLGIYAGCTEDVFDRIYPVLSYMGENIIRMGENGKGIIMKICQNALSHEIQAAVNETLTLAQLNGISVDDFARAVSYGGARNYYLESKYEAIRDGDYEPAFPVEYALKDLKICERLSKSCNFSMPALCQAISILNKAADMGLAKADNCACIEAVRQGTSLDKNSKMQQKKQ